MAPHSSTLAWKIPWMEEPGGLQSMGSLSGTQLSDFTFTFHFHALEKEIATHSSVLAWRVPGTGSLAGCRLWGRTESDTTEATQQQQQHAVHVFGTWVSDNCLSRTCAHRVLLQPLCASLVFLCTVAFHSPLRMDP